MPRGVSAAQLFVGALSTAIIITGVQYSGAREPSPRALPHVPSSSSTVQIPAVFVPNDGRLDSRVRFYSRGAHHAIFATDQGITFAFEPSADRNLALGLAFVGAGANTKVAFAGTTPTRINYFSSARPTAWRTNVPAFHELVYRHVWRDIDASVRVHPDRLKYQFRINPGGDPSSIRLRYDGATRLNIDEKGELEIDTPNGTIVDAAPRSFQSVDGRQIPVPSHFVLLEDGQYGIAVGEYDLTQPLVIDPAIMYASYLGSSGADQGHAIAVDASGSAYVTGSTQWIDFPVTTGAYQTSLGGGDVNNPKTDAFVVKINASGSALEYATYLGGSSYDEGSGIAVDASGNAYVTGFAVSNDFPITPGAFQQTSQGPSAFVTKLNTTGSALVYSTYYGGIPDPGGYAPGIVRGYGIATDASGRAYVVGSTEAPNIPGAAEPGGTYQNRSRHGFLMRLGATGSAVEYATIIGGSRTETAYGVAVSGTDAFVTGFTTSADFPTIAAVDASGSSAIAKTRNAGANWERTGVRAHSIQSIAQDPTTPAVIYAGSESQGVFKSSDGGDGWAYAGNGIPSGMYVFSIAVNPNTPNVVYAATPAGVYQTSDGGANWSLSLSPSSRGFWSWADIAINATGTATFVASGDGLSRSLDGGATWGPVLLPSNGSPITVATDRSNPSAVVIGMFFSPYVYRSGDGGETWSAASGVSGGVRRLRANAANTIYAAGDTGLFKSTDGGASFARLVNFGTRQFWDVAVDGSTTPPTIYAMPAVAVDSYAAPNAAANGGDTLLKSTDGGAVVTRVPIANAWATLRTAVVVGPSTLLVGVSHGADAFVARVNTSGIGWGAFVYSTYLAGVGEDVGTDIAVDGSGNAYVTGWTQSGDFPAASSTSARPGPNSNAFVAKLTPNGAGLSYARVFGGAVSNDSRGIGIDASGSAYIGGQWQGTHYVAKLSADGGVFTSLLLGDPVESGVDGLNGVAVGPDGSAFVVGSTTSTSFPTTPGSFQPRYGSGASDAFVARVAFASEGGGGSGATGDIVIYADDIPASARHGAWTVTADSTAAAGVKLLTPDNGVSNTVAPLSSPTHYVDIAFDAPAGTPFAIWLRMQALGNSKYNDSVWLQFSDASANGSSVYPINSTSGLAVNLATDASAGSLNGWGWQKGAYWLSQATTVTFSASGTHTLRIQTREDGAQIDQIILSPYRYLNAVPGSATNDHTIVPKSAPTSTPTPPGTPDSPGPADGATGVATEHVVLTWGGTNATSWDLNFGTGNPPTQTSSGLTTPSYSLSSLTLGTTYYWQIVAHNGAGATTGPVWSFTTAPPSQRTVVIYASDIRPTDRHGSWTAADDPTAAGGVKLVTADNGVANLNVPLASPTDYVDVDFNADAGVPHTIWLRMQALNNSKYNDAVWVQFSDARAGGAPVYSMFSTSGLLVNLATDSGANSLNTWGWQNTAYWLTQATQVTFATSGWHRMRIQVREDGVQFDQIVLSPTTYATSPPGPVGGDHIIVPK